MNSKTKAEIKLGTEVKIKKGYFAGEKGVIVGIIACDADFADPYYEVKMDCGVPDKYKCRKTLHSDNNVIGGVIESDFEVIGERASKHPADKIKIGDRVRVPDGEGCVRIVTDNMLCVQLDNGEWQSQFGNPQVEKISSPSFYEDNSTDKFGTITIPVKADLDETYWQAYRAELAKELAIKLAGSTTFRDAKGKAAYVIALSTEIVDNLKKQSE